MAKLTRKQQREILSIKSDLDRLSKYLFKDNTLIAMKCSLSAMPENLWENKKTGITAIEFNKLVGTELCYLQNAIQKIDYLILEN
jgi:hypothetical protein